MEEYKVLINKINNMIKKRKKNVFNNAIQDGKSTKHVWTNIKVFQIIPTKALLYLIPFLKIHDDITCVLNSLNQHFIDISDIVSKSLIKIHSRT